MMSRSTSDEPGGATRVAIFVPSDLASRTLGGIQTFVRGFIKFAPPDIAIEVIGASSDPDQRPVGRWQRLGVAGRDVPYLPVARAPTGVDRARVPVALRFAAGLVRHARRIPTRRRVLQFHRAGTPLAYVGRRTAAIQVVHLNVADIYAENGESRWRTVPGLYHLVEGVTIGRMARVFFVNSAGLELYARRHPELADRFQFMPTWFDPTLFRAADEAERAGLRRELAEELALPASAASEPLFLFVGRLEEQKDPLLAVDAFAAFKAAAGTGRLLIVGDGTLRPAVERRIKLADLSAKVIVTGAHQPEAVARLMRAADALLLASRFEGMPIAMLEALGSGLPVVATAVGEVARVVHHGVAGWLTHDHTPAALAEGLAWAVARSRTALAAAARQASAPFAAEQVLAPFYAAHREVWRARWSDGAD